MKKTSQIILYTFLAVLICALVVTAVVKKNFAPSFTVPTYESRGVEISQANIAKYEALIDEKDYNKFVQTYNSSFDLSILYALFSGKIDKQQTISVLENEPSLSDCFIVTFNYATKQVLKVNGKDYVESTNSDTKVEFTKVFFPVTNAKGLTNSNFYIYDLNSDRYYCLTTLANFDALNDLIVSYNMFAEEE